MRIKAEGWFGPYDEYGETYYYSVCDNLEYCDSEYGMVTEFSNIDHYICSVIGRYDASIQPTYQIYYGVEQWKFMYNNGDYGQFCNEGYGRNAWFVTFQCKPGVTYSISDVYVGTDTCIWEATVETLFACTGWTTLAPTVSPTASPTVPTVSPTTSPSMPPTASPTKSPTLPTISPTESPTISPTRSPSAPPTVSPTASPTSPTVAPSVSPTVSPSFSPSASPTVSPTISPTRDTRSPTAFPTMSPSKSPTSPTNFPTQIPTPAPSSKESTGFAALGLGAKIAVIVVPILCCFVCIIGVLMCYKNKSKNVRNRMLVKSINHE